MDKFGTNPTSVLSVISLVKKNKTEQQLYLCDEIGQSSLFTFRTPHFLVRPIIAFACSFLVIGSAATPGSEPDIRRDAAVNAIEKVMPSVVNIATETVIEYHEWYDDMLRQFYGWSHLPVRQQKSISLGSGVIIDEEGYVLTNFHVVRRANRIQVKLWDGREYEAETRGKAPGTDVALLKLKAKPGEKFKAIKLAPDDDLLLGETVLALGNPYGLGGSVTKGILSSKNRRPSTGDEPLDIEDWLQTDAAINPGNSGGPLVNLRGELIGLNVAVYREKDGERGLGVGFSIPVKHVSAALSHLFRPESSDSLWFGAEFKAGSPLLVSSVEPGSPAAKAGLRVGNRLLAIDGKSPQTLIDCNRLLVNSGERKPKLRVEQGSENRDLTIQLLSFEDLVRHKTGLTLLEITAQTAQRLGVQPGEELYIDAVEKNSPADHAQLQRGYLLAAVGDQRTSKLNSVAEILVNSKPGQSIQLTVIVPRRLGARFLEFQQGAVELEVR
jgi:S1-C subfamily serine protease